MNFPNSKVELPKQIEISTPEYELVQINPKSAEVAKPGDKNEG